MFPENHYLGNTNADVRLLGQESLLSPFLQNTSAQRGMMLSSHVAQALCLDGAEHPRIFTGYETIFGQYEVSSSGRDQSIQIIEVIPLFTPGIGQKPINENPRFTVIFRGCADNKIDYINIDRYTRRSSWYGYENKLTNFNLLSPGNLVTKDVKFATSPIHDGNKYMMGTNVNVAYMAISGTSDDAFVISESLAERLTTTALSSLPLSITQQQIPLNLYGQDDEYKFFPDIGEAVREDGILCGFRTPTPDTFIRDVSDVGLITPQPLHDTLYYAPPGAIVTNVEVYINRKCRTKTPQNIFEQTTKYRDAINRYHLRIWEVYRRMQKEGQHITPKFCTLVTRAIANLKAEGIKIPGYNLRGDITLKKKKDDIEFMHLIITYKYKNYASLGFKLTGRNGDKGVISTILPDEEMPVDDYGFRADIIQDPGGLYNRMNPGQSMSQFITRAAEFVAQKIRTMTDVNAAYAYLIEFLTDVNPKYAQLVDKIHGTDSLKKSLIDEVKRDGIYMQISPFQKNMKLVAGDNFVTLLRDKYGVKQSPVSYVITLPDGTKETKRTKNDVLIGSKYEYLLHKMPHVMACGFGFVNQYGSPSKPRSSGRSRSPINNSPVRFGEDEVRNMIMFSGINSARFFGIHAHSPTATNCLMETLVESEHPMSIDAIPMTTGEIIQSNAMSGIAKHMFSCVGVDITSKVSEGTIKHVSLDLPTNQPKPSTVQRSVRRGRT